MSQDEVMTLAEAAERLDVHYMTAYRWVRTGQLDAWKSGGQWRVNVADLKQPERRKAGRKAIDEEGRKEVGDLGDLVQRLQKRLVAGDEPGAWQIVEDAIASGLQPQDVHLRLIGPAMQVIGDLWDTGDVTIADEHRASAVAARIVGRAGPLFRRPGTTRSTVLIGSVEGDRHALPVSMLADVLRQRGFSVIDIGADTPALSIISMIPMSPSRRESVDVVALCSTVGGNRAIKPLLAVVRSARPGTPLLLGGAAIRDQAHARRLGADSWTGRTAVDAADAIERAAGLRSDEDDQQAEAATS